MCFKLDKLYGIVEMKYNLKTVWSINVVCVTNFVSNFSVVASKNSYSGGIIEKWNIFSQNDWTMARVD